jgi:hypothetical protein
MLRSTDSAELNLNTVMPILKNPRHEQFAREYVKIGIGAEAYRRVYPRIHPLETAKRNAYRLRTYTKTRKS